MLRTEVCVSRNGGTPPYFAAISRMRPSNLFARNPLRCEVSGAPLAEALEKAAEVGDGRLKEVLEGLGAQQVLRGQGSATGGGRSQPVLTARALGGGRW